MLSRNRRPMRRVNEKRQARKLLRNFHGPAEEDHAATIRRMPCCACGRRGLTEPAHVTHARGMGGANGDWSCIAPLCGFDGVREGCHRLYDEDRAGFRDRFPECDPVAIAAELAAEYLRRNAA